MMPSSITVQFPVGGGAALGMLGAKAAAPAGPPHPPETVPVGIMTGMLIEAAIRGKSLQTAFVPYRPLDGAYTPRTWPDPQPSQELESEIQSFYKLLGKDAQSLGADTFTQGNPNTMPVFAPSGAAIPPPVM